MLFSCPVHRLLIGKKEDFHLPFHRQILLLIVFAGIYLRLTFFLSASSSFFDVTFNFLPDFLLSTCPLPTGTKTLERLKAMDFRPSGRCPRTMLVLFIALLFKGVTSFIATSQMICSFVPSTRRLPSSGLVSTTALAGMWSQDEELVGADRIKACVPYLLPLMDGDQFGHYIYSRIPFLGAINDISIGPLATIAHNIPFLSLGLFVALTLGTRFNMEMPRTLRFSAQQAALIDVALIVPELIASSFDQDPLPRSILEPCANFVWYAYMTAVIYSVYTNMRGKKPDQIPFISQLAENMVGPF